MLKQLILSAFLFLFISCEKESNLTSEDSNANSISEVATLMFSGPFTGTSGITVTGSAKIYNDINQKKVLLDNFTITDGPDLKVYLSTTSAPNTFVNLGALTSSRVYLIPNSVDLSVYKYVLIHCQQYNHLFAIAELK